MMTSHLRSLPRLASITPAALITLATLASLVSGCSARRPPVLHPQVQHGPAAAAQPARVLVLPAACGSVEAPCPETYINTVDTIVRGGLEFVGFNIVEGDKLFAQTRQRSEEHTSRTTTDDSKTSTEYERSMAPDDRVTTTSSSRSTEKTSRVVLDGPTFADLALEERQALLAQTGADSFLSVRIIVGGNMGVWTPNQNVEVMVKLGVMQGDLMAWASRCLASSNDFSTVDAALEAAARCAIYGGTGHQERGATAR